MIRNRLVLAAILAVLSGPAGGKDGGDAGAFVARLLDDLAGAVAQDAPATRVADVRDLVAATIAIDAVSAQVVGPTWAAAAPHQRAAFRTAFAAYAADAILDCASATGEAAAEVAGVEPLGDGAVMVMVRVETSSAVSGVQFRLLSRDGGWRIADMIVDGTSWALITREEFQAVIARDGGTLDGLIAELRHRAAE